MTGQPFESILIGRDFYNSIENYLEKSISISDGNIGIGGAPELFANEKAASIAPNRITGNYGSELFRKIRAFKYERPNQMLTGDDGEADFTMAQRKFNENAQELDNLSFVAFFQAQHQSFGRHAIERSQLGLMTPFMDSDFLQILYRSPRDFDGLGLTRSVTEYHRAELLGIESDRGYFGQSSEFISRMKRHFRLLFFKAEYALGNGMPDRLNPYGSFFQFLGLERLVLGRNKFYHPRIIIRDYLSEFIRDRLSSRDSLNHVPFINFGNVQNLLDAHFNGRSNFTREIDRILTLVMAADQIRND